MRVGDLCGFKQKITHTVEKNQSGGSCCACEEGSSLSEVRVVVVCCEERRGRERDTNDACGLKDGDVLLRLRV